MHVFIKYQYVGYKKIVLNKTFKNHLKQQE